MSEKKPSIPEQQAFWNAWNASTRERFVDRTPAAQAEVVLRWLERLGRTDLKIIDVGCGAGWLSAKLAAYGSVTATDLSDDILARACLRTPEVEFIAGDFMKLDLPEEAFDVAVSLEVLSHVEDQRAFISRVAHLLRSDGSFMLATQNRPALERNHVPPPGPGQLRRWVDRHELAKLLEPDFRLTDLFSITPSFNRGPLRLVNSTRLWRLASRLGLRPARAWVERIQEKAWLGWTLMACAQKRPASLD